MKNMTITAIVYDMVYGVHCKFRHVAEMERKINPYLER